MTSARSNSRTESGIGRFQQVAASISSEVSSVIVGQNDVLRGVLIALFAGGHVLLEGVPGVGKTRLVRTLASTLALRYQRTVHPGSDACRYHRHQHHYRG